MSKCLRVIAYPSCVQMPPVNQYIVCLYQHWICAICSLLSDVLCSPCTHHIFKPMYIKMLLIKLVACMFSNRLSEKKNCTNCSCLMITRAVYQNQTYWTRHANSFIERFLNFTLLYVYHIEFINLQTTFWNSVSVWKIDEFWFIFLITVFDYEYAIIVSVDSFVPIRDKPLSDSIMV